MAADSSRDAASFFRGLADPTRLRLLGALAAGPVRAADLAVQLGAPETAIRGQIASLQRIGLVADDPPRLDLAAWRRLCRSLPLEKLSPEEQILRNFVRDDRLVEIPAKPGDRRVVLAWLVSHFDPSRAYAEREVNDLLLRHHPDFAALRRYLVDEGFLTRDRAVYRVQGGALPGSGVSPEHRLPPLPSAGEGARG